jgi:hypothetical protein
VATGPALIEALPIFEDLEGKAPDDVADDWELLVTRIRALDTALHDADVDPATYDARHPPAGLSAEDRGLIRPPRHSWRRRTPSRRSRRCSRRSSTSATRRWSS